MSPLLLIFADRESAVQLKPGRECALSIVAARPDEWATAECIASARPLCGPIAWPYSAANQRTYVPLGNCRPSGSVTVISPLSICPARRVTISANWFSSVNGVKPGV